jgi:glycine/sarcosine/betaine reductase complex component A
MSLISGKKAIIIGDRDGVPGPAIEECIKAAGAEIVYSSTECFV